MIQRPVATCSRDVQERLVRSISDRFVKEQVFKSVKHHKPDVSQLINVSNKEKFLV